MDHAQYSDAPQSRFGAANHYLRIGFCKGYNPSPLFDTRLVPAALRRRAVFRYGLTPHYLYYGFGEGRDPGPDFDTGFISKQTLTSERRVEIHSRITSITAARKEDHRSARLLMQARPPEPSKLRNPV